MIESPTMPDPRPTSTTRSTSTLVILAGGSGPVNSIVLQRHKAPLSVTVTPSDWNAVAAVHCASYRRAEVERNRGSQKSMCVAATALGECLLLSVRLWRRMDADIS